MPVKPTQLSDTQLVILTAAAAREDGRLLPPPTTIKARGSALTASLQSLIDKGLTAETEALPNDAIWREADGEPRLTLMITEAGLAALGLGEETLSPAEGELGTSEVLQAPGETLQPSSTSKRDRLIALLSSPPGASVDTLTTELGWLPHTLRAAISGLRKRGLDVETIRHDGVTAYRFTPAQAPAAEPGDE